MSTTTHKTRDHHFAYITRGDITKWAKGTSRFAYPEPKNKKRVFVPITSKNACEMKPISKDSVSQPSVMIAPPETERDCRQEMESLERKASAVDRALAISDDINRKLGLIK